MTQWPCFAHDDIFWAKRPKRAKRTKPHFYAKRYPCQILGMIQWHNYMQTQLFANGMWGKPSKPMLPKAISKYQWAILQTRCQHVEAEIGGLCWVIVITCICWEQTEPQKMRKTSSKTRIGISPWRAIYSWSFFRFLVLCFPVWLIFCFSAFLLLWFSTSLLTLLLCFSCSTCFSAFLLFVFPASLLFLLFCFLLFLLLCFSASLLLYFCAFLLLLFNLFFSSVMCFCCSTSCSLLLCFLLSLCFSFSFALFCSACIPNETLERP